MKVNIAAGNDVVAVQVGARGVPDGDNSPGPADIDEPADGTTVNIRTGNARVGLQADVIAGGVWLRSGSGSA